ncbi:MFS transporter [Caballeronia sp. LZ001]|uniref:MFS transporter n=1 Tax=Caballeronia sp. LZ001 TaxID=3038553 RepID=UPI0028552A18|nr:MFS transporter [Caballeronia sp. LZ001]MDR5804769.1 MFS transporter [Caballeronia sp. LZ001]
MLGIGTVNMLVALDQTVVSTALPSIVSDLSGFEYYAWIANAYLLASIVSVPIFGRLGDFFGRKPFLLTAIATFTIASTLCGIANSMLFLVAARALQGIGGGMMVGTAYASVPDLFPDARSRVRWQVVLSTMYGVGTSIGPTLGGFLTEHLGWRSTFLINLPVGLVGLALVLKFLPRMTHRDMQSGQKVQLDLWGATLIAAMLILMQLCLERFPSSGLTEANALLGFLLLVCIPAFLFVESRHPNAIMPLDLFKEADFVKLLVLSILAGMGLFSLLFFIPLLLQAGFGLPPEQAGILATPLAACSALGSVINTRIVVKLKRPVLTLTFGFSLMLLAALGVLTVNASTSHLVLTTSVVLAGIGIGFCLNNMNVFGHNIVGRERFGIATALLQSSRMIGGMLGTTLMGLVVTHSYIYAMRAKIDIGLVPNSLSQVESTLLDPQLLVDETSQRKVFELFKLASYDGHGVLSVAREVMVHSVHIAVGITLVAALAGTLLSVKLLHITLAGRGEQGKRRNSPQSRASTTSGTSEQRVEDK